mmetsp:Transcript_33686/g.34312  ORF Transcript_33686/g.34312 Transcript_33686/m.34312 type:complete len:202 (+) Transcript_33686:86-691(+)|eukprot:CAMPEP_0182417368 /NCGR_PEP_ID=MMETSP1167-20130531/1821_1 /TAXON_ID=2988 /ORGANISM="Mallomonas Sp, Strain CCMP3275" /LENGTH=201 /DNA_ID=CAMNT_0024590869 /DNA_START=86 /DNA_END=691 /DNA_ORIENTATION=+
MIKALSIVITIVTHVHGFVPRFNRHANLNMKLIPGECDSVPSGPAQSSIIDLKKAALPFLAGAAVFSGAVSAWAEEAVTAPADAKPELGTPPEDFGISGNYYDDATRVVKHMRYACQLQKGDPIIVDFAGKTKKEMNEFVSSYRRFNSVNGRQSFSLLYTSISVLAGHYTSYGLKFPVPEKRRKRLLQEFNDIEKNIRKKR